MEKEAYFVRVPKIFGVRDEGAGDVGLGLVGEDEAAFVDVQLGARDENDVLALEVLLAPGGVVLGGREDHAVEVHKILI